MPQLVSPVRVAHRFIGPGTPCFVIAEAGVNHNGDVDLAMRLVDAAADCGADAVKFQTFNADRLVARHARKAAYQLSSTPPEETHLEMLRRLELPEAALASLQRRCQDRRVLFLSTPYDEVSVDVLDGLDVPALKIASCDLTNMPLLRHAARTARPLIVATGMADLDEVDTAVNLLKREHAAAIVLLHCVSNYPADPASANLRAMHTMTERFGVPTGWSDHTPGIVVALAAAALGACVIEKHFTVDKSLPGPDHRASLDATELTTLVRGIREVERALGDGQKRRMPEEEGNAVVARRSLVTAVHVGAGTPLRREMLAVKRPGTGLAPALLDTVLGRRLRVDAAPDTVLTAEMLDDA